MRVLIADDEPIARRILREHLEELPDMVICGEAATGAQAVETAGRERPDVVFLDLQMPGAGGFAAARVLKGDGGPLIVFVTAYDTHALEAYNIGAVDYLVKPVRRERLAEAIEKVKRQMAAPPPRRTETPRRIAGRAGSDLHLLDPADIVAFRADGDIVHILAAKGKYLAGATLRELEGKLASPPFRRIHRSAIINADHIRKISPLSSKRWLLKMSNGLEVVVSKRMAGVIREETGW